jgi:hypothetical protein
LAGQVEIELFQLFSSVSKQYRQKARSLIFNLKGTYFVQFYFSSIYSIMSLFLSSLLFFSTHQYSYQFYQCIFLFCIR